MASFGSEVMESISCKAACPTPARLSTQLNRPAPARVIRALAVVKEAAAKFSYKDRAECWRLSKPNSSAYRAATAPASVGVKTPDKMPPMMISGIKMAGMASSVTRPRSPQEALGEGRAPTLGAMYQTSISMARPARMPGITPPMNRAPIDTPVTEP